MIYLDHHATTPLDPRVLQAMMPYLTEHLGNPASAHHWGNTAYDAVERARVQVARLIGADPAEIIFTSGATESNNLVIKHGGWRRVIASRIEHSSVHEAMLRDPERDDRIYLGQQATIHHHWPDIMWWPYQPYPERCLISVMLANNELGIIHDIAFMAQQCHRHGIPMHTDASQGLGYIPFNVHEMPGLHYASLSAHKIYGPKGVGALYISGEARRLPPAQVGGGQEQGIRAGTLNVPGIVGMGEACQIMHEKGKGEAERIRSLRDQLYSHLIEELGSQMIDRNGIQITRTLPQTLNLWIRGVNTDQLAAGLSDVAVSTGSACHAHSGEPSHVLRALYPETPERWQQSLRMAVGRFTTEQMVEKAARRISEEAQRARG